MQVQSSRFSWSSTTSWVTTSSTSLALVSSTSLTWLRIWKHVGIIKKNCWSSVSSNVAMGVVNISKACGVLIIKIIFWPIPIWYGVRGKIASRNFKGSIPLTNTVNEGRTCS